MKWTLQDVIADARRLFRYLCCSESSNKSINWSRLRAMRMFCCRKSRWKTLRPKFERTSTWSISWVRRSWCWTCRRRAPNRSWTACCIICSTARRIRPRSMKPVKSSSLTSPVSWHDLRDLHRFRSLSRSLRLIDGSRILEGWLGIRRDHPRRRIEIKFCVMCGFREIVARFKFHHNWSSGFRDVGGGSKFALSHCIGHWLMQQAVLTVA